MCIDGAKEVHNVRPGQGNAGRLFLSENVGVALKAFIGCFRHEGVRIEGFRVFLQSLHLAPPYRHSNRLHYVFDSSASR